MDKEQSLHNVCSIFKSDVMRIKKAILSKDIESLKLCDTLIKNLEKLRKHECQNG
jgi:hypothetical protein